ncbi:hypothetical protein KAU09_01015 [Candidatus Parcubacteria bacterium]|nr:hypothetical protein [Candidatus Parcubacteria bacterium]
MENDFQKTVNLKKRMQKAQSADSGRKTVKSSQKSNFESVPNKAEAIDQVFNDNDEQDKQDFQKINRPANNNGGGKNTVYKQIIFILLIIIIAFGFYLFINKNKEVEPVKNESNKNFWYSIKLINGEFYYGQIKNTGADPVVLENVYYNYDQINSEQNGSGEKKESGNLRLVKRGKETHGPDGSMSIVRTQVVYMEPLREDSKVLKAILDYEK